MTIGTRLKEIRERSGRSAREVSLASDLSVNMVAQIEKGEVRNPGIDTLLAIAKTLGISPSALIEAEAPSPRADGFHESDVLPFTPRLPAGQRPDLVEPQRLLPQTLAPLGRQLTTYRLRAAMPGFALLPGDVLVVDLKTPPRAGDLVLANVADLAVGSASTVLRRYLPPYLVANEATADDTPLVVDNHRTSLLGRVAASFRAPQLDSV